MVCRKLFLQHSFCLSALPKGKAMLDYRIGIEQKSTGDRLHGKLDTTYTPLPTPHRGLLPGGHGNSTNSNPIVIKPRTSSPQQGWHPSVTRVTEDLLGVGALLHLQAQPPRNGKRGLSGGMGNGGRSSGNGSAAAGNGGGERGLCSRRDVMRRISLHSGIYFVEAGWGVGWGWGASLGGRARLHPPPSGSGGRVVGGEQERSEREADKKSKRKNNHKRRIRWTFIL